MYARDELFNDDKNSQTDKYANFSIVRYKRTLNNNSYIGGIYTGRDIKDNYNRVAGVDGQHLINSSNFIGFYGFMSSTKEPAQTDKKTGNAFGINYLYFNRNLDMNFGFQNLSKNFTTETGYVTRTGISTIRASATPKIYLKNSFILRINPNVSFSRTLDKLSKLSETNSTIDVSSNLMRDSFISLSYDFSSEIFLGEKYKTNGIDFSGQSQITKRHFFEFSYRNGKAIYYSNEPYQGYGNRASVNFIYQHSDNINSDFSITYSDFYREVNSEKIYDYTIIRNKLTYQVNRYFFFRGIIEYNTYKKHLMTDFLASFTYIPGTVLHLGYGAFYEKLKWDNAQENPGYIQSKRFLETKRGLFFKASYLWRM